MRVFLIFIFGFISLQTHASLVSGHIFKTETESLSATLDTTTGIEWLRGSATLGNSYSDILERLDTDLKGWRLPTASELENLMFTYYEDLDPNMNSVISYTNYGRTTKEFSLSSQLSTYILGQGFNKNGTNDAYALFINNDGEIQRTGLGRRGSFNFNFKGLKDATRYADTYSSIDTSFLLVSDGGLTEQSIANPKLNEANPNSPYNTPGPLSIACIGLAIIGLRKHRQKSLLKR